MTINSEKLEILRNRTVVLYRMIYRRRMACLQCYSTLYCTTMMKRASTPLNNGHSVQYHIIGKTSDIFKVHTVKTFGTRIRAPLWEENCIGQSCTNGQIGQKNKLPELPRHDAMSLRVVIRNWKYWAIWTDLTEANWTNPRKCPMKSKTSDKSDYPRFDTSIYMGYIGQFGQISLPGRTGQRDRTSMTRALVVNSWSPSFEQTGQIGYIQNKMGIESQRTVQQASCRTMGQLRCNRRPHLRPKAQTNIKKLAKST